MPGMLKPLAIAVLLFLPPVAFAESAPTQSLDLTQHWAGYFSLTVMILAYVAAMLEEATKLRKSKPMLLAAALIWFAIVLAYQQQGNDLPAVTAFKSNLQAYIELLLFIMVSMTYLNAMEDMRLFDALKVWLVSKQLSYRQLFWITGSLVFLIYCKKFGGLSISTTSIIFAFTWASYGTSWKKIPPDRSIC